MMDAVVVVVVVNKGNEERPGDDGKGGEKEKRDAESLEFCFETSDHLRNC